MSVCWKRMRRMCFCVNLVTHIIIMIIIGYNGLIKMEPLFMHARWTVPFLLLLLLLYTVSAAEASVAMVFIRAFVHSSASRFGLRPIFPTNDRRWCGLFNTHTHAMLQFYWELFITNVWVSECVCAWESFKSIWDTFPHVWRCWMIVRKTWTMCDLF